MVRHVRQVGVTVPPGSLKTAKSPFFLRRPAPPRIWNCGPATDAPCRRGSRGSRLNAATGPRRRRGDYASALHTAYPLLIGQFRSNHRQPAERTGWDLFLRESQASGGQSQNATSIVGFVEKQSRFEEGLIWNY